MGTAFEEVLEPAIRKRLGGERPSEFIAPHDEFCPEQAQPVIDGVPCLWCAAGTAFSPDWLFFDPDILGEFKFTTMSMKDAPTGPKFDRYWTQIKLYLHWLGWRKARLFVLFAQGDYAANRSPVLRAWEATFTTQELRDEYDVLIRFARKKGLLTDWVKANKG